MVDRTIKVMKARKEAGLLIIVDEISGGVWYVLVI